MMLGILVTPTDRHIQVHNFIFPMDGITFIEKYCDNCIEENRHLKENKVMDNFDNLFIKAEPGNTTYDQLHTRNTES
jgi:hypothetical protein